MKKLLLISLFLSLGIFSCNKKDNIDNQAINEGCYDCILKATYYSNGVQTNYVETTSVSCGTASDIASNEAQNTHSDSTLVQTYKCTKQN